MAKKKTTGTKKKAAKAKRSRKPQPKFFKIDVLPVRSGVWTPEQCREWMTESFPGYSGIASEAEKYEAEKKCAVGVMQISIEKMVEACVESLFTGQPIEIEHECDDGIFDISWVRQLLDYAHAIACVEPELRDTYNGEGPMREALRAALAHVTVQDTAEFQRRWQHLYEQDGPLDGKGA